MNKVLLYFLIFAMLMCGVLGTAQQELIGDWSNYQNTESCSGHSDVYMSFLNQSSSNSLAYGSNFEPLIVRNQFGVKELIVSANSYLFAVSVMAGNIVIDKQVTMNSTQGYQAALARNGTIDYVIIPLADKELWVYKYNGTNLALIQKINTTLNNASIGTGIVCSSWLREVPYFSSDICYFGATNKRFAEYDISTNTIKSSHLGVAFAGNPAVSINFNGARIAVSNNTNCPNTAIGGGVNIIIPNYPFVKERTIAMSSFHCADNLGFYDVNGAGFDELVVANSRSTATQIVNYDSNGNIFSSATIHNYAGGSVDLPSGFVTGHFTRNIPQICAWTYSAFASGIPYEFACYNASNMGLEWFMPHARYGLLGKQVTTNMVSVDVNGDGFDDLVTPFQVIDVKHNTYVNLSTNTGGFVVVGDVSNDVNSEIVGSIAGKTWVASGSAAGYSSSVNLTLLVEPSQNFGSPICAGTSILFTHKDCAYYPYYACSYLVNRNLTQEYLYSTCGNLSINPFLGPFFVGLASDFTPQLSCYFGNPGVYDFRMYLTNSFMHTVPATNPYTNVHLVVVNGTPGVDCNTVPFLPLPVVIPSSVSPSLPNVSQRNEVQYWGTAGGNLPLVIAGFLILVGLTVAVIVFLAKEAKITDGTVLSVVGCLVFIVGFIALTFYGFFPIWILLVGILFVCFGVGYLVFRKLSVAS